MTAVISGESCRGGTFMYPLIVCY